MRNQYFLLVFICITLFAACTPPEYSSQSENAIINIDYRDKKVQHLLDLRDQNRSDSLIKYLQHPNTTFRYLAALSFASIKDSFALEPLAELLNDKSEDVKIAAALSIGQMGTVKGERFLINAFLSKDSTSSHQRFNGVVLDAIGRCGTLGSLKNLANISTYQVTDTMLLEGQCKGIYRFATRGMTLPEGTAKMITYVADEKIPEKVRLIAANYLARAKDITPDSLQAVQMAIAYIRSVDPNIRMAIAKGLGKSTVGPAFAILSKVINTETDYRVKCNIINGLAKFKYDTVRSLVTPLINDPNIHVSRTAAEFFIQNGQPQDGDFYWRIAKDNPNLPWQSAVALYRASNKWLSGKTEPESKDFVNYRLKEMYQKSTNPYERAACLSALGEFGWQYRYIHDRGFNDPSPVVKSTAAEIVTSFAQKTDFYRFYGEGAKGVRREIYNYLREAIAGGDAGMIATAAEGLRSEALNYKELRDSVRIDDFKASLAKLKMPKDVEAYYALEKTIAYFEGLPAPVAQKPKFNHPIEWSTLNIMGKESKATIQTKKGTIVLELYPQWAPGSVANFLKLINEGFYNGKIFHRVAQNFVIQTGCPRGDGYGALDYTIRTEISPLNYDKEGWVGMASAGKDTEGTQFFITHSPTPHLDGNYTIFAKVIEGMDVAHQIQMGDTIEKITVK
jgi:cyclophilin family peptidyl-prolyl cis-trans isomerase/HEAT repeat protein